MSPRLEDFVLAAAGDVEQLLTRVLPWLAALVGALTLLASGLALYRSRRRRDQDGPESLWTLQELREMHARGDLDEAEYQRLRDRLLGLTGPAGGTERTGSAETSGNDGRC